MPHRSAVVIVAALLALALLWMQTTTKAAEGFSCSPGYQYADGECKASSQK
jgi:hypothetical protein